MFKPQRDPTCSLCPLSKDVGTVCVTEEPLVTPIGMIIGEAPGANEDMMGKPFLGRSGQLLDEALLTGGIDRRYWYVTNTVRCRPPSNRKPEREEILACSSNYLIPEFQDLRPDVILLLGNTALHTFTDREGITRNRGEIKSPEHIFLIADEDVPFIPLVFATYHPSAALRMPTIKESFMSDIISFCNQTRKVVGTVV